MPGLTGRSALIVFLIAIAARTGRKDFTNNF